MSRLVAKIPGWTSRLHMTQSLVCSPVNTTSAVAYSKPRLQTFWKYAKVELRPPTPGEVGTAFGDAQKGIQNLTSGKFMKLTVREGWQNALVVTEVLMWFFVGEIIGRRSLIGYKA